ncbi:allantoinase AllB [Cellulomonas dongxiuzhuiae]|uniref:allantoinase n=1 Tax=Cellulomonas dongxiuzhuiae TaxID=2819979 RepID=A0ABX8GGV4_9CELL|nr:allantoinase AllB [Cellulomonas dongxiuzhuiae]MBO3094330.1 allantoinase AllB [Cellulomonas dongxiuzhuiae]QWC15368.1 allantoinase AllB [Cellulomonas dongxiuzhuiae]
MTTTVPHDPPTALPGPVPGDLLVAVRGRQVLVDGALRPATLHVADGRVVGVGAFDDPAEGPVLTAPDHAYVLPGVVDTHVHVNEPGRTAWEGFASATRAAALGGVTTLVDMPLNSIPPTTTTHGLAAKRRAATGQLSVDVALWGGAVPGNLDDLRPLWDAGVMGFKCFLSPSGVDEFPPLGPAGFEAALRTVAAFDGLVIVHAEDPAVLDAAPVRPGGAYRDFVASRPHEAETAAIARVVAGARATGCRVHVLHLSSARALDLLADARAEGLPVTVETCPHYLTFDADAIPDASPAHKCCPPIRDAGNREALWDGLRSGVVDVVVTDHSPATAAEKLRGDGDLQQAWGGVAGLQVGFQAVAHGALARGIDIAQVSRWMSTSTADLVGLTHKGRLTPGADADVLVLDPRVPLHVDVRTLAHRNPISAYDGLALSASVTATVLRGRVVARDGAVTAGTGRLLSRT